MCWLMLPKDEQTAENVETHFRRIVECALKDLRADSAAFRAD